MFHPDLQVAIKGIKELVAQGKTFLIDCGVVRYSFMHSHRIMGAKRQIPTIA